MAGFLAEAFLVVVDFVVDFAKDFVVGLINFLISLATFFGSS